jgi:hypothetical protein
VVLFASSLSYDQRKRRNFYLTFWEAFMMRTQGVRTRQTIRRPTVLSAPPTPRGAPLSTRTGR